jgi:hypothetical protein
MNPDEGMVDIDFLKKELVKFEDKLHTIQKRYKKMEDMLKSKKTSKEYMVLLSKAFYIQGKLSVLDNGFEHKPDISYIG